MARLESMTDYTRLTRRLSLGFMSSPSLARLITACLWIAPLAASSWTSAQSSRPNIVLILADDHGWGDVSYHGGPHLQTPNIDRIARSGIRLSHFYANSSVCLLYTSDAADE